LEKYKIPEHSIEDQLQMAWKKGQYVSAMVNNMVFCISIHVPEINVEVR